MSSTTIPPVSALKAWVLACRPATLPLGVAPVLVGSALAHAQGGFHLLSAVAALLGALLLQIGANLANDLFDARKGADTPERLGPVRVTQAGLLTERQVLLGMCVAFILAMGVGGFLTCGFLTYRAGWPLILVGLLSLVAGFAYTGGPWPLGYNGLGDVCVFLFFGLVAVCGTVWVETGGIPWSAYAAALPMGALSTAVLVVNNLRDEETDRRAGKRTLVVRWGRHFGLWEYQGLLLLSYAVPFAFWGTGEASPWVLLPLCTLPQAWRLGRAVACERGAALNPRLVQTARLCALFSLLFALGFLLPCAS